MEALAVGDIAFQRKCLSERCMPILARTQAHGAFCHAQPSTQCAAFEFGAILLSAGRIQRYWSDARLETRTCMTRCRGASPRVPTHALPADGGLHVTQRFARNLRRSGGGRRRPTVAGASGIPSLPVLRSLRDRPLLVGADESGADGLAEPTAPGAYEVTFEAAGLGWSPAPTPCSCRAILGDQSLTSNEAARLVSSGDNPQGYFPTTRGRRAQLHAVTLRRT